MDVFVKYGGSFSGTPAGGSIAGLLSGNINENAVGVENGALTSSHTITTLLPDIITAVSGTNNEPKAYLQYLLLDENFGLVNSGEVAIGESGNTTDGNGWEHLVLSTDATQDGYLFAYVVNESNINVYFDDFTFSILGTRVIRKTDYYPFGAVAKVWKNNDQAQQEKYRHGYQGEFSEMDTTTGWNSFQLRMYDPLIGRWLQVDPYRQFSSSYLGMGNSPIIGFDPDGGFCPSCTGGDDVYALGAEVTNSNGSWQYLGGGDWLDLNASANPDGFSQGFWNFMSYLDTFVPQGKGDVNSLPIQFVIGGKGNGGSNSYLAKPNPNAKTFYIDYDELTTILGVMTKHNPNARQNWESSLTNQKNTGQRPKLYTLNDGAVEAIATSPHKLAHQIKSNIQDSHFKIKPQPTVPDSVWVYTSDPDGKGGWIITDSTKVKSGFQ